MNTIIGAIFPVSMEHSNRIFKQSEVAFVKYSKFRKLERNLKIIFYVSKEKILSGEGTIEKIETLDPEIAWVRFGNKIFLNRDEFNHYAEKSPIRGAKRKMSKITVYLLKNLKKYSGRKKFTNGITPAGRYVSKNEYTAILHL